MAARTGSDPNGSGEPRPEKVAVVTEVRERLSASNGALLTEYRGLKVSELARLRQSLREAGGEYGIYKNTLVRLAAVDLGLDDMVDLLVGPTAIAFVTGDPVAVAKSLRDFAKTNPNLTVKGGLLGAKVLSASEASALADVAPREVVLAQLAGALAAPLVKMAGLLQALPRNFAYGLKALLDQKAASEPAAPEPEAVESAPVTAPEASSTDAAPTPGTPDAPADTSATAAEAPTAPAEAPESSSDTAAETPADTADASALADTPADTPEAAADGAEAPAETADTQEVPTSTADTAAATADTEEVPTATADTAATADTEEVPTDPAATADLADTADVLATAETAAPETTETPAATDTSDVAGPAPSPAAAESDSSSDPTTTTEETQES
jgi:large subunit ribosomal protein L10